ncbi:hypothetical protein C2E23DRAFT_270455 [Lenzites betulinus]|nr:hypothetical protein C2E23DRAFT_270455 [Lenzites betulinus]
MTPLTASLPLCEGPTYALRNVKGGTVLHIHMNPTRVIGFPPHFGQNQLWKFIKTDNRGWYIQSCQTSNEGRTLYLSVANELPKNGTGVVASLFPTSWDVNVIDGALSITLSHTILALNLDGGNPKEYTKVELWSIRDGIQAKQLWYSARCDSDFRYAHDPTESDVKTLSQRQDPKSGAYVLEHAEGSMVLELDSASRKRVISSTKHARPTLGQQWRFIRDTSIDGEVVQACWKSLDDEPLYLTVRGLAQNGARVVASPYPVSWRIERHPSKDGKSNTVRIFWPETNLVVSAPLVGPDAVCDVPGLPQYTALTNTQATLSECDGSPACEWTVIVASESKSFV